MASSSARANAASSIRRIDADELEAYVAVWNAITPNEPASVEQQRERLERKAHRLHLLAEQDGRVVGCGFAGPSDSPARGFLSPRVLPEARRRGLGTALLRELANHLHAVGLEAASSFVDGNDPAAVAFARHHGFDESDRQVEQVWTAREVEHFDPPAGVVFVTIAERPEFLRDAYPLGAAGWADMVTSTPVTISLEDWLEDEATFPEGSFVALADGEIVGYAGLCRRDVDGTAEDGLTVVRRDWRRRGLATALKQAELAWAAANGIHEVVTWTQRGNDGIRAVNERLGYAYRDLAITVRAPLPLEL
jgi:GNAT superfamily N-acetyltransferase